MTPPFNNIDDFTLNNIIQDTPYSMAVESYQNSLQRKVFIKLLKPQVKDHQLWIVRFQREAQICAMLKNRHIVDVYTMGEKESYTYMAMEFVEGLSLKELLKKEKFLCPKITFEITRQVLLALEFAHQQKIIHRDIKPGNILIDIYGEVRITDFGLAYLGEENSLTQQGNILGTPAYMSPEQITGESLKPASDFFSLGATIYEMLTGIKPFAGDNYSACIQNIMNLDPPPLSNYNKDIIKEYDDIVNRLLEKDANKRPENASFILDQLKKIFRDNEFQTLQIKSSIASLIKKYYNSHSNKKVRRLHTKKSEKFDKDISKNNRLKKWIGWTIGSVITLLFLNYLFFILPEKKSQNQNAANITSKTDSLKINSGLIDTKYKTNKSETNSIDLEAPEVVKNNIDKIQTNKKSNQLSIRDGSLRNLEDRTSNLEANIVEGAQSLESELDLTVRPWAQVAIDGNIVDSIMINKKLLLNPGIHQVLLTHPEFSPKLIEFEMISGQKKQINFSFLNEAGFLSIEVRPWADIYIDGKHIDSAPMDRLITLGIGEHLIELKNPYYDTYRKVLNVVAGDTIYLKQQMYKMN
jgi:serine/threonine protein kinase